MQSTTLLRKPCNARLEVSRLRTRLLTAIRNLLPSEEQFVGIGGLPYVPGIKYAGPDGISTYEARRDQLPVQSLEDMPVDSLAELLDVLNGHRTLKETDLFITMDYPGGVLVRRKDQTHRWKVVDPKTYHHNLYGDSGSNYVSDERFNEYCNEVVPINPINDIFGAMPDLPDPDNTLNENGE